MCVCLNASIVNLSVNCKRCVCVCLMGGGGCSWLFPVGEWQVGGEGSVCKGHSGVTERSDSGQLLLNKLLHSRHLLRTGAMHKTRIGGEADFLR